MMRAVSKHRRFDSDGNWIPGNVKIRNNSSLKKLMSAARRGKLPDERQEIIDQAVASAAKRFRVYQNSYARLWGRPV